eukprot:g2330.t1
MNPMSRGSSSLGEPGTARAAQILDLLEQCRHGVSLMAHENDELRRELGIEDGRPRAPPGTRSSSAPQDPSVPANDEKSPSASKEYFARSDSMPSGVHNDPAANVHFSVANLWKKVGRTEASAMQGGALVVSGDLMDLSATDSGEAMRMNGKNSSHACRMPHLPLSPNSVPKLTWDIMGLLFICPRTQWPPTQGPGRTIIEKNEEGRER